MSFRVRLTLFFALIVVLPMIALAVLVTQIAADSANGKTDARLQAGLVTATSLFDRAQAESLQAANRIAARINADPRALAALAAGDRSAIEALAQTSLAAEDVATVGLRAAGADSIVAGSDRPAAIATVDLVDGGDRLGAVTAAAQTARSLLELIETTTGEDAAFVGPGGKVLGSAAVDADSLPASGESSNLDGAAEELRVAATQPLGVADWRIALTAPAGAEGFLASRPKIALALFAFFATALLAVVLLLRSLQGQTREMLGAAKRIGKGDFSRTVPVRGRDEMAGLASEFNKMSGRLSEQMKLLRRQQLEIESSVRRVGEAFASGLDRSALLSILVETAVSTCEAEFGVIALRGQSRSQTEFGDGAGAMREVAIAAESRALNHPGLHERELDGAFAIASSFGTIGGADEPAGAMTIARRGRTFTAAEREVFLYLLGQASVSVENLALHELVSEQAVTDELTGLANNRAFRSRMENEIARATRFGHPLSLLILDIDDFKRVNDVHGHLQGDEVLRAVAEILEAESRGIDEPARYGGEEFVVALPETDHKGAVELAERIRTRIASEPVPLLDSDGEVGVTASIGVATIPDDAGGVRELIAVADAALYDAKRAGKDRVHSARDGAVERELGRDGARARPAKGPAPARRR